MNTTRIAAASAVLGLLATFGMVGGAAQANAAPPAVTIAATSGPTQLKIKWMPCRDYWVSYLCNRWK